MANELLVRLWRWLQSREGDEQFLAAAHDLADLERRQRILERQSGGPQFVTFNH